MVTNLTMKQYLVLRSMSDLVAQQPWALDTGLPADVAEDRIGKICAELGRMGYAKRSGRRAPAFWKRTAEGRKLLNIK